MKITINDIDYEVKVNIENSFYDTDPYFVLSTYVDGKKIRSGDYSFNRAIEDLVRNISHAICRRG